MVCPSGALMGLILCIIFLWHMPAKILSNNDVENQVSKSVFNSKTVLLLRICILGFSFFFVRHFEEFGKKVF
jgi:hypothetical protein